MTLKWIGAMLILTACCVFVFMVTANHKKEIQGMKSLISALDYMECELQYRMCALPDLCRKTAYETDGILRKVFTALANELEDQISPDVRQCMHSVLAGTKDIPTQTLHSLQLLGDSLGRFNLEGQLKGLEAVRQECRGILSKLMGNTETRIRSYQTLGLCAGAAIIILLI